MNIDEKQLAKIEKMMDLLNNDMVSNSDMAEAMSAFVDVIQAVKEKIEKDITTMDESHCEEMAQRRAEMEELESRCMAAMKKMEKDHEGMAKEMKSEMLSMKQEMMEMLSECVKPADLKNMEARMDKICEGMPEEKTAEDIRDSIQDLPEGDRWRIKDVDGLEERLDELKTARKVTLFGGSNAAGIKNSFKDIDISSQLNGVTKTFNIQGVWYIIAVHCSAFPHALRKTIDYTWTPTSITFTSQINAESTLATGQTVIISAVLA